MSSANAVKIDQAKNRSSSEKVPEYFFWIHNLVLFPYRPPPLMPESTSTQVAEINTHCYGRPLLQAWLLPDLNTIPTTALGSILFSSMVMVLADCVGGPGSNPVRI